MPQQLLFLKPKNGSHFIDWIIAAETIQRRKPFKKLRRMHFLCRISIQIFWGWSCGIMICIFLKKFTCKIKSPAASFILGSLRKLGKTDLPLGWGPRHMAIRYHPHITWKYLWAFFDPPSPLFSIYGSPSQLRYPQLSYFRSNAILNWVPKNSS